MKVYRSDSFTGIDSLAMREETPPPNPGPGQVLMRIEASALNHRELLFLRGVYKDFMAPGFVPLSDGAGTITAVGDGVRRVQVGDRVAATFYEKWIGGAFPEHGDFLGRGGIVPGMAREAALLHEDEVVKLPAHLSAEEGATLPCAAVTAWSALCAHAPLHPGETVVVQGSGGVSVFALQFAKLFGARIIATSSSDEKCARLRELGAEEAINYRTTPEWGAAVRMLTGGRGVDLVVEVGGAGTFHQSLIAGRAGGRISVVGLLTGAPSPDAAYAMSGLTLHPIRVGSRDHFEAMNQAIAHHKLRPVIDSRFSFAELPEALHHLESGAHMGKIVIRHA